MDIVSDDNTTSKLNIENYKSCQIWLEGYNSPSTKKAYKIHLSLFCRYHNIERSKIVAGVGPLTIDPKYQNKGTGRQLMNNVIKRAQNNNFQAIRLLQASYHNRSLTLYASLGFEAREPISNMQGKPIRQVIPGRSVRVANESDVESCNTICKAVHGHNRSGELNDSIKQGTAKVCEGNI